MKSLSSLLVSLVPLLIGSANACASELVARQGPWATECTPNIRETEHSCRVVTRFPGSASAAVRSFEYSLADKTFAATVTPAVSELRAQVDGSQPFSFNCSSGRCALTEAAALLEQLKSGDVLLLQYESQGQHVQDVSLDGFSEVYRRATSESPSLK
jgi:hypothetical protein